MQRKFIILFLSVICMTSSKAQYNTLWIPDTLSGSTFNLTIKDTFKQIIPLPANQTITGAINGNFWGPTLIFNQGDEVHMNVRNNLNDSTTIHWHGMHLPAVMDGGPHQIIPPGTLWQPFWKVTNSAATYWYHPHLHEMSEEQITKGIGGLIIVRDSIESALPLPRAYGVDDIPLILTDRAFTALDQFSVEPYGDSMITNGVLRAAYGIPAQVVRFRVLNGAVERSYNLGFSDSRTFYVISSDGGLLNAPVGVTRYILHAGERIEILVNAIGQSGTTVDLKAYNSTLDGKIAGGDIFPSGPFANALARKDFNILHLTIGAATSAPITAIPTTLTTNRLLNASDAMITRQLTISDSNGIPGALGTAFVINHKLFAMSHNEYEVPLNNTEIWEITSTSNFGHPFHIHDVEFNILSVNGVAPVPAQAGWKDVVFIPAQTGGGPPPGGGGTPTVVRFIAKFDDYADSIHPFMFHCHIALHEDEGMMNQFIVTNRSGANHIGEVTNSDNFTIYPNPADDRLYFAFDDANAKAYYVTIVNAVGKTVYMLPSPQLEQGIDISSLSAGVYTLRFTDSFTKLTTTKKFIKK